MALDDWITAAGIVSGVAGTALLVWEAGQNLLQERRATDLRRKRAVLHVHWPADPPREGPQSRGAVAPPAQPGERRWVGTLENRGMHAARHIRVTATLADLPAQVVDAPTSLPPDSTALLALLLPGTGGPAEAQLAAVPAEAPLIVRIDFADGTLVPGSLVRQISLGQASEEVSRALR